MAPLLPKLRGQFAEFLNESSHKRLRILTPPTCVGLRYGHVACIAEREFSWQLGSATFFGFDPYFRPYLYPDAARGMKKWRRPQIRTLTSWTTQYCRSKARPAKNLLAARQMTRSPHRDVGWRFPSRNTISINSAPSTSCSTPTVSRCRLRSTRRRSWVLT